MKRIIAAAALVVAPTLVSAGSVDLSGWQADEGNGSPAANWAVQGAANDSVFQSVNSRPSVFYDAGANDQGKSLKGSIKVETTGDDDYIGFVLGFNTNEFSSTNADFWLIDWKQGNQAGSPGAGLRLSHVTGDVSAASEDDFWAHANTVNIVQSATNLGTTGWADNVEYTFDLVFTASLIEVKVNGVTEISYAGSFTDGAFGFYNYSQSSVRYAGITEDVLPPTIPLPASSLLLVGGMGGIAALRRRRRKA